MVADVPPTPPTLQHVARTRIQAWLTTMGVTQQAICHRVGVTQPWLSRYLHGKVDADVDTLAKLADAFGHSIAALFTVPGDHPDEQRLIERYRALSPKARAIVQGLLDEWTRPHPGGRSRK